MNQGGSFSFDGIMELHNCIHPKRKKPPYGPQGFFYLSFMYNELDIQLAESEHQICDINKNFKRVLTLERLNC